MEDLAQWREAGISFDVDPIEIIPQTWRVPRDLVDRLKARAGAKGTSVNQFVCDCLTQAVESTDWMVNEPAINAGRSDYSGHARIDKKGNLSNHDAGWTRILGPCKGLALEKLHGAGTSKPTVGDFSRLLAEGADLDGQIVFYSPEDHETPILISIEVQHNASGTFLRIKPQYTGGQWVRRKRQIWPLPPLTD